MITLSCKTLEGSRGSRILPMFFERTRILTAPYQQFWNELFSAEICSQRFPWVFCCKNRQFIEQSRLMVKFDGKSNGGCPHCLPACFPFLKVVTLRRFKKWASRPGRGTRCLNKYDKCCLEAALAQCCCFQRFVDSFALCGFLRCRGAGRCSWFDSFQWML